MSGANSQTHILRRHLRTVWGRRSQRRSHRAGPARGATAIQEAAQPETQWGGAQYENTATGSGGAGLYGKVSWRGRVVNPQNRVGIGGSPARQNAGGVAQGFRDSHPVLGGWD